MSLFKKNHTRTFYQFVLSGKKLRISVKAVSNIVALVFSVGSVAIASTDTWVDNGNNTVIDVATGLIWQQQDDNIERNHADAITDCQTLVIGGNTGWRLPNIKELASIVDYRTNDPAIDVRAFLNTKNADYWSITSNSMVAGFAWAVRFGFSGVSSGSFDKVGNHYVRCVR